MVTGWTDDTPETTLANDDISPDAPERHASDQDAGLLAGCAG